MRYLSALKSKNLSKKICLLRLDFNTEDNWRLQSSAPTLKFLSKNCKAVVILSHKGRPEKVESYKLKVKKLTLGPHIEGISRILKKKVFFIQDFDFNKIKKTIWSSLKGSVFLLENLRFLSGERGNSKILAKKLASLGDIYVNDAFAVSHRKNASVVAITKYIKSYAGLELEEEIKNLSRAIKNPKKPLVVILGGGKINSKVMVVKKLIRTASVFLIGGALDRRPAFLLKLPKVIIASDFIKKNGVIQDIGPYSRKDFCREIRKAKTIIWNGPLGDIIKKKYCAGTEKVAECVVKNKKAFTVVGGGETIMFLKKIGLDKKINFISTGGGAMLEFLAGKKLPGIAALNNQGGSCLLRRESRGRAKGRKR